MDPAQGRARVCDVFIKFGGSILDDAQYTAALVPHIVALADEYRIVMMSGGGRVAKRIVANQRTLHSDFHPCWKAGITSLDVNSGLLASYSPRCALVSCLAEISRFLAAGRIAVLAPAQTIVNSLYLTPDFDVTTDSMGLYFAHSLNAQRYIIISNVDGLYARMPGAEGDAAPIPCVAVGELESLPSSKLDPAFPQYFRNYAMPTVIVNGKYPARVSSAIHGRSIFGTEIVLEHRAGAADQLENLNGTTN